MTHPNIVDYWAALRAGDPEAVAALDHARSITVDMDDMLARTIRAEARAEHLDRVIRSAANAIHQGNSAGALHVLTHAHDQRETAV